jgi:hypothetical protein
MSRQLKPRIADFLADQPHGAPVWQIAEALGSSNDTTVQALRRMAERGEAVLVCDFALLPHTVWTMPPHSTPKIFRAMETLQAMQSAARRA